MPPPPPPPPRRQSMAPVTRARRNRASITGEAIEPLSPALTSNTLTPFRPANSHVRFDQEEETPVAARRADEKMEKIAKGVNAEMGADGEGAKVNGTKDVVPDSEGEEEEEDSDDDAPEAVSMGAGKKEAEQREEEAKRVVEAQKEATKKKRKDRDTKLKEQKAEAEGRKRERESKRRKLDAEQEQQNAAIEDQLNREALAVIEEEEPAPAPVEATSKKSKPPLLLPESLLAQVSARPSPPPIDEDKDSDEDMDAIGALVPAQRSAGASTRLEKNRRRREQKKKNKILKKGVVNVRVLKDEAGSRKSMAPPASKQVAHIKESWLQRSKKGVVERRSVGGGFIRKK